MRQTLVFAMLSVVLVGTVLAATWPLLDAGSWRALAIAAGAAFGVQASLHVLLKKWRERPDAFVASMVTGAAVRMVLVVAGLIWAAVGDLRHPVATLLGFVGFVFGMLLIESTLENLKRFRSEPGATPAPAGRG